jgi:transcriptional regulator with XRE-family HTH domain
MKEMNSEQKIISKERTLGEKVAAYRKKNNWTQLELSQRTGIARDHISRIETGRVKPKLKTIELLENVLNIPRWTLLENDETYDRLNQNVEYERDQVLHHISNELRKRDLSANELRIVEGATLCFADSLKKK